VGLMTASVRNYRKINRRIAESGGEG
jgi:hypothetical protein